MTAFRVVQQIGPGYGSAPESPEQHRWRVETVEYLTLDEANALVDSLNPPPQEPLVVKQIRERVDTLSGLSIEARAVSAAGIQHDIKQMLVSADAVETIELKALMVRVFTEGLGLKKEQMEQMVNEHY